MKNLKIQTIAYSLMSATLYAGTSVNQPVSDVSYENHLQVNDEEMAMIHTSKKHKPSRLISMKTANVLESYGLGFSGSGNIHKILKSFTKDGIQGSFGVGLGDVIELGYELTEMQIVGGEVQSLDEGHIKLQILNESAWTPSFSVAFSSNINSEFVSPDEGVFKMERSRYQLLFSKSFTVSSVDFSVHPSLEIISDEVTSGEGNAKTRFNPQLGLTWNKSEETMFILESRLLEVSDFSKVGNGDVKYENALENNLAIRFHFRNWLMMDAGIRYLNNLDTGKDITRIHANFTGVIPMKSLGQRIYSWLEE